MADKKITQLTNITGANLVDADEFVVVDISADETKAITLGELKEAFDSGSGFVRITGDTMTGDLALSGADVTFGDNDKAIFGAGSDLQIYHDGASGNSHITETGSGSFYVRAENLFLQNTVGATYLQAISGGETQLRHNNAPKLATTSTGVDITGTLTSDGLTVGDGTGVETIRLDKGASSSANIQFYSGGAASGKIEYNAFEWLITNSVGQTTMQTGAKDRLNIASNGDISFYEDTGTTPKFFWDASAEGLAIGDGGSGIEGLLDLQKTDNTVYSTTSRGNGFLQIANASSTAGVFAGLELIATGTGSAGAAEILCIDSGSGSGDLAFSTRSGGTWGEKVRILAGGNVGIGTTSPSTYGKLVVDDGKISLVTDTASSRRISFWSTANGDSENAYIQVQNDGLTTNTGEILFATKNQAGTLAERMRIDSSGNLLVGQTSINYNDIGGSISAGGTLRVCADSYHAATFNRKTSDGDIAIFYKNGSPVGSIGIQSSGFIIDGEASHTGLRFTSAGITPRLNKAESDNTVNLGESGVRFKDLYLSGGVQGSGSVSLVTGANSNTVKADGSLNSLWSLRDSVMDLGRDVARWKNLYLSGGVVFGTGGPSPITSNTLDDYETGTWTLEVYDAITGGNVSSTTATGYYTKVGRLVTASAVIVNLNTSGMTSANELWFTLPFTSGSSRGGGAVHPQLVTLNAGCASLTTLVTAGIDRARIVQAVSGNQDQYLKVSAIGSGTSDFSVIQFIYEAA